MSEAKMFAKFDGMAWPLSGQLEWTLRYGEPTRGQMLHAAWILSAYDELIRCPEKKRRVVIRELRRAGTPASGAVTTKEGT